MSNIIFMPEEFWMSTHFSIARHYGKIGINGTTYIIVNKEGATIFELSDPNSKYFFGENNMAIHPGEPADLVMKEWIPIYKALGRNEFINLIKKGVSLEGAKSIIEEL